MPNCPDRALLTEGQAVTRPRPALSTLVGGDLPRYIRAMRSRPYLVGIAGGSGSGKTTLVRALQERMPEGAVSVISQDDYYHPIDRQVVDPRGRVNFDLPTAVDLDRLYEDMERLSRGEVLLREEYTFNQHDKRPRLVEVLPAPVVLVEGLFVLHHAAIRERFDLRVYVETPEELQLERRLKRDLEERGYGPEAVRYQWEHHVLPAYREYLLPYRHLCDMHVVNHTGLDRALPVLADHMLERARAHSAGVSSVAW